MVTVMFSIDRARHADAEALSVIAACFGNEMSVDETERRKLAGRAGLYERARDLQSTTVAAGGRGDRPRQDLLGVAR